MRARSSVFEVAFGKHLSQLNNALRGHDQFLFLWGEIECLDVNERRVCGGDGGKFPGDIDGVEPLLVGGRLLADGPKAPILPPAAPVGCSLLLGKLGGQQASVGAPAVEVRVV